MGWTRFSHVLKRSLMKIFRGKTLANLFTLVVMEGETCLRETT
jgi:hypothetical protein